MISSRRCKKVNLLSLTYRCTILDSMQPNKYLQHIIRKNNKSESTSVADLQAQKDDELKTYLYLIQKRLDL